MLFGCDYYAAVGPVAEVKVWANPAERASALARFLVDRLGGALARFLGLDLGLDRYSSDSSRGRPSTFTVTIAVSYSC